MEVLDSDISDCKSETNKYMTNRFLPCTQSIQVLTIFLLQGELALLSSCKIWNINNFFFKDLGHDVHISSEEIFFMMWTSAIITFGILSLPLHPLGFRILASWTWAFHIRKLISFTLFCFESLDLFLPLD